MSRRIAVVHEAEADFEIATHLADRVIVESIPWMDIEDVPFQRTWQKRSPEGLRLSWTGIDDLARSAGITVRGHFDDEPAIDHAKITRRAILYLAEAFPDLAGIVLIRDRDDEHERQAGIDQGRRGEFGVPVVVGLAVVMREAWVLCGFNPLDEAEAKRLAAVRQSLGRDPQTGSHAIPAPKAALHELTAGDLDRERRCWTDTPLDMLRQRGTDNGLAGYLGEVQAYLAPLFGRAA